MRMMRIELTGGGQADGYTTEIDASRLLERATAGGAMELFLSLESAVLTYNPETGMYHWNPAPGVKGVVIDAARPKDWSPEQEEWP